MANRSRLLLNLALNNQESSKGTNDARNTRSNIMSIENGKYHDMDDDQLLTACDEVICQNTGLFPSNYTADHVTNDQHGNSSGIEFACEQLISQNKNSFPSNDKDPATKYADEHEKRFEIETTSEQSISQNENLFPSNDTHSATNDLYENNIEIDVESNHSDSYHSEYIPSEPESYQLDEFEDDIDFQEVENLPSQPMSASINQAAESRVPLTQLQKEFMSSVNKAVTKAYKKSAEERVLGKSYIGYTRSKKGDNKVRRIGRTQRMLSPTRCSHTSTKAISGRSFLCGTFSEDDRQKAFSKFWATQTWNEKKGFIRGLVSSRKVIRRRRSRKNIAIKKREGHDIFLKNSAGKKVRVCRKFFLKTLNIGEDMFRIWVKDETLQNESPSDSDSNEDEPSAPPPTPRPPAPFPITPQTQSVLDWLDLLPKVPSHYCRSSNTKKYVESTFFSRRHMHRIFQTWCQENNKKSVGRKRFNQILGEENIAIHRPRKDQCDTCFGHKQGNISDDEYNEHREKKSRARAKKKMFEEEIAGDDVLVVSMDLQSVLLCPKIDASSAYYKQKLQIHNFTIYEKNSGHVELYVWHESSGGVTANEFNSCIVDYITRRRFNFNTIILISDGCNYQNRNKILGSTLSSLSAKYSITIRQLILEKGHTMMPCDSVHSATEHYFKSPIFAPSEYVARMRLCRPDQPYNINVLDFSFFRNYESVANVSSIRPGKRVGDPVVCDIRQLLYTPDGSIKYDLDYSDNFQLIPIRRFVAANIDNVPQLRSSGIAIEKTKFAHLQDMKSLIPTDHHQFYDSLPH